MTMNDALAEMITSKEMQAYPNEAPKDALYPYAVISTKRLQSGTINQYRMSVNIWDQRNTWNRAEALARELEKRIDHMRFEFNDGAGMVYKDTNESVVCDDKKLKKIELTFEVRTVEE